MLLPHLVTLFLTDVKRLQYEEHMKWLACPKKAFHHAVVTCVSAGQKALKQLKNPSTIHIHGYST